MYLLRTELVMQSAASEWKAVCTGTLFMVGKIFCLNLGLKPSLLKTIHTHCTSRGNGKF